ncbi:hypothetical protein MMC29_003449 [Sticta canariensis]|nr:hypothetical protein [Sticta canariensis]
MAYDLPARFYCLQPATSESTPTLPTAQILPGRDNNDNNPIRQAHGKGTDVIRHDELSDKPPLSIRAADAAARWPASVDNGNHASSLPIDVPVNSSNDSLAFAANLPTHDSHFHERSPLEGFLQNRRTSITFNPQVTLDSGHYHRLEDPLPRLEIGSRQRRRSLLQELSRLSPRSPLSRSFSDPDGVNDSSFAANSLDAQIEKDRQGFKTEPPENHHRYSLLHATDYGLEHAKEQKDLEQGASLTSASTASLLQSEIQTPRDGPMDCLVSPISPFSPFHHPTSLDESSTWPVLQRQGSAPHAKSCSFGRKELGRQGRRQSSRRSTASSMSPATAFLNKFAGEEAVTEPDAEGQLVGEYVLGNTVGFGGFSVVKKAFTIEGDERICRAVKIVRKHVEGKEDMENEQFQAEFERQIGLWRCLAHRHILSLIGVHVTNFATFCFTGFSSGGTLFDLVRANRKGLGAEITRRYSFQLASAIRYLHEDMRIVHRDIKLENCLIDFSEPGSVAHGGNILLADFGLAEFVIDENTRDSPDPYENIVERPIPEDFGESENGTTITGTLEYASPELILGPPGFLSRVVDVWALGVVIYALIVGSLPFQHSFPPRVRMMIIAGEWNQEALLRAAGAMERKSEVMELMNGCLNMNAVNRWKIGNVLYSRWLNGCQAMLEEITQRWTV